jgi:chromosome segregation ATPase
LPSKDSRIDVLHLEKKVSELEERMKSVEKSLEKVGIEDLEKRLEDLEDLVMVENALMVEIKKMMESSSELIDLKDRVKNIENSLSSLTSVGPEKVKAEDLSRLSQRIESIEKDLSFLRKQISTTDFNELKESVEKRLAEGVISKNIKEILEIQNMVLKNESRIDNIEKSIENLKTSLKELQPTLGLENVKKIGVLSNEVARRIEETRELVARFNALQSDIEKRITKITTIEDELGNIKVWMDKLSKEFESINAKIFELTKRQEENRIYLTEKILAQTEGVLKEVQDLLAQTKNEVSKIIESKVNEKLVDFGSLRKQMEELANRMAKMEESDKKEIESLKTALQEMKEMQVFPEERLNELMSRNVYLEDKISALEKIIKELTKVSPLVLE